MFKVQNLYLVDRKLGSNREYFSYSGFTQSLFIYFSVFLSFSRIKIKINFFFNDLMVRGKEWMNKKVKGKKTNQQQQHAA